MDHVTGTKQRKDHLRKSIVTVLKHLLASALLRRLSFSFPFSFSCLSPCQSSVVVPGKILFTLFTGYLIVTRLAFVHGARSHPTPPCGTEATTLFNLLSEQLLSQL